MSIATEITRLQNAKASIKTSIENKGVTVPSATKLDGYSALIDSIQTGGGGISVDDIAQNLQPSGAITLDDSITQIGDYAFAGKPITSVYGKNVTNIMGSHAFTGSKITSITDSDFPSLGVDDRYIVLLSLPDSCTSIKLSGTRIALSSGSSALRDCKGLVTAEFPNCAVSAGASFLGTGPWCLAGCTNLEMADLGFVTNLSNTCFYNSSKLSTIILRNTSLVSLTGVGAFTNTPFKNGGTGGEIYVPSALLSSYPTATNWSTVNGYGTITWKAIEGSIYE